MTELGWGKMLPLSQPHAPVLMGRNPRSAPPPSGNFLKHGGTEDTEYFVHALISLLTLCLCVLILISAVQASGRSMLRSMTYSLFAVLSRCR